MAKTINDIQRDLHLYSVASNNDNAGDRLVIIRVNGLDYVLTSCQSTQDGILGEYVVFDTQPLSSIL